MAKKASIHLQASELNQIKSFYEQERMQLASRLHHIDQVIARLSGGAPISDPAEDIHRKTPTLQPVSPASSVASVETAVAPVKRGPGRPRKTAVAQETKSKKAGRPKKRGPKSVWGNFILRRLRQCDRPLSYGELIRDAMVLNNLPPEKAKNAKQSILNAAFRLRNTLKKIDTVGLPGKKEKFLVLSTWLEGENQLKDPYAEMFKEIAAIPMDDRGRKPRRPSQDVAVSPQVTEKKGAAAAVKKAPSKAAPTSKKAAVKVAPVKKPVATKAKPAAKRTAKPVAKKTAAKRTAKPVAKKTAAPKRKK